MDFFSSFHSIQWMFSEYVFSLPRSPALSMWSCENILYTLFSPCSIFSPLFNHSILCYDFLFCQSIMILFFPFLSFRVWLRESCDFPFIFFLFILLPPQNVFLSKISLWFLDHFYSCVPHRSPSPWTIFYLCQTLITFYRLSSSLFYSLLILLTIIQKLWMFSFIVLWRDSFSFLFFRLFIILRKLICYRVTDWLDEGEKNMKEERKAKAERKSMKGKQDWDANFYLSRIAFFIVYIHNSVVIKIIREMNKKICAWKILHLRKKREREREKRTMNDSFMIPTEILSFFIRRSFFACYLIYCFVLYLLHVFIFLPFFQERIFFSHFFIPPSSFFLVQGKHRKFFTPRFPRKSSKKLQLSTIFLIMNVFVIF